MEALPPIPILPTVVRVPRVELPEMEREEAPNDPNIPADVTFTEAPIPTLPTRLLLPDIPRVAPEILLVTDNESKTEADVTVKDLPIPTLPETDRDDPIPTKELKYPVPLTSNLYPGVVVPIPTLP